MKLKYLQATIGVLLIVVIVSLVGIEISDNKIVEFNNDIILLQLDTTNKLMGLVQDQSSYLDSKLYNYLQPPLEMINFSNMDYLDEDEKALAEKFINGEISKEDYLYQEQTLFAGKYYDSIAKVDVAKAQLVKMNKEGTPWIATRNIFMLIGAISLFLALLSFGYLLVRLE